MALKAHSRSAGESLFATMGVCRNAGAMAAASLLLVFVGGGRLLPLSVPWGYQVAVAAAQ